MTHLRLKLLGSYRVILDGQPIDALESDKERALLAYLAMESTRAHPREKLIGIFWPGQNDEHARGSLSQALYHLRGVLGDRPQTGILPAKIDNRHREPFLWVTPREIQLNPNSECETDAAIFLALVKACEAHAESPYHVCEECLQRYQRADKLYTGDFLDDLYLPKSMEFEEWATVLREQLRLQEMDVLEILVWVFERKGELEQALIYARKMVRLDELREQGNQHVIRLLASLGRRDEALAQYNSFSQVLAVQLGSEPGIGSQSLSQRLRHEMAGMDYGNMPGNLTPFIGRRNELDELWDLLRESKYRLICVLGPGGSGKTRLALEAANRQRYYFKNGTYFVPLSALGSGSSLLAAIAGGLDFTFRDLGDQKRQLLEYLRHKEVLLILDSFEMVVESAGLVSEILAASQGSKALVTSRVRLDLSGEYLYPLAGMRVPPAGTAELLRSYSSVEFFLQAAQRMKPGYMPEDLEGVAHVCRLVDGVPLSLLLASTWVNEYSPEEIAAHITRSLDFLSVEWADFPTRQRSLRATFEYSWNLLKPLEQQVLMKLAVMRNPFTSQSAHEVAGASPHVLHGLVGKSLLGRQTEGRFQMHDLVRQFSAEKLALEPEECDGATRQRHSVYFLGIAEHWNKLFKGSGQSATLAQADMEIDDVRAAWDWAAQSGDMACLSLASEGLFLFYFLRYRFREGEQACIEALKGLEEIPASAQRVNLESWLSAWLVHFSRLLGKIDAARQITKECLLRVDQADADGEDTRRARALLCRERGYLSSNLREQIDFFQQSADLFQSLGESWWQALVLSWAGEITYRMGNRELGMQIQQQAEGLSRNVGEPRLLARALMNLSYGHLTHGSWETGAQIMEESAHWYRSIGDLGSQATAELHLGVAAGWVGQLDKAIVMLEMALVKLHTLGDRYYIAYGTGGLGVAQMHAGNYAQADVTLKEALQVTRQDGFRREETFDIAEIGCLALVRDEPTKALDDLLQSVASFRQMGFAGELGMALGGLALTQHRLRQDSQAWASLREALQIAVETHSRFTLFTLGAAVVILLADASMWEQAVEAYTAMMTDPIVSNSRWFADMVGDRMEQAREQLPEDVWNVAESRGREGDFFEVLGRLAKVLSTDGMVIKD